MEELKSIFPTIDNETLQAILVANNNDMEATVEYLLGAGGGDMEGVGMGDDRDFIHIDVDYSNQMKVTPTARELYLEGKRVKDNSAVIHFNSALEADIMSNIKGMKAVKKLICLFIQDKNLEKAKEYFDLLISDYPCLAENGWVLPSLFVWLKDNISVDENEFFNKAFNTIGKQNLGPLSIYLRQAAVIIGRDLSSPEFAVWKNLDGVVTQQPSTSLEFALTKIKTKETGPLLNTNINQLELEGKPVTYKYIVYLEPSLRVSPKLTTISITGVHGARLLAFAIKGTSLQKLTVLDSKITTDGAAALFTSIKDSQSLTTLNLDYNTIGSKLLFVVPPSVTSLDLSNNCVGDEGVIQLAKQLKRNHPLNHLLLSGNEGISATGLTKLGKALKDNTNLRTLNLSYIDLDTERARAFFQAIKGCGHRDLNIFLHGNDVEKKLKEEMKFNSEKPRFTF